MSSATIDPPVIVWFRRDLRLTDNPALAAAVESGAPVIPLFVLDQAGEERPRGGASLWWLDKALGALAGDLRTRGSRLILRRGDAAAEVARLAEETGARAVFWNRLYEPAAIARDTRLKADLRARGLNALSFNAALLAEPWTVRTGAGEPFKVFTPFWRAVRAGLSPFTLVSAPSALICPQKWPGSENLDTWGLHPNRPDWSSGFKLWTPGEVGAGERLERFLDDGLLGYGQGRDMPGIEITSRLSPHLHWGEIGPRQIWRAVETRTHAQPGLDAEADKFLSELGWREFNHHILFHNPHLGAANFRPSFDRFAWRDDPAAVAAWSKGLTGYPVVDAGMRELWATGFMHNRVRMVAASFLIKHLLTDWRVGEAWFWDTLVDADLANNAGNWQWVAGSGADAAPYFRIFNPTTQGEKFDPKGVYVRRWIPELKTLPDTLVHRPWEASSPPRDYPPPIIDHCSARARALEAYGAVKSAVV